MSWNPLNAQKRNQMAAMQQREVAAKVQAKLVAENPKPPRFPAGPLQDASQGIAFGPRRRVGTGRKRKSKSKKTARRLKK